MADESLLRQAWVLYKQSRFTAALESLEPRVFQFRENPDFFRVLGLCCLRLGDWKGGETYLKRSLQLDSPAHRDTLLGLLTVAARRRDFGEAVKYGLELLDRNPKDKTAKKVLERLRAALGAPEGTAGIDKETLNRWLPRVHRTPTWLRQWLLRGSIGLILAGSAAVGIWWGLSLATNGLGSTATGRPGPETWDLPVGSTDAVLAGQNFTLTLSPAEIRQSWAQAQKAFQNYQDSRARYEINRLLLSNASAPVKEQARALIPFLHEPNYARPEDSAPYLEVRSTPVLFEGCTVRWTGVLANLISGDEKITFDLLLGYQDGQVVEGIVPVELGFAALLKNSQIVEVLGKVVLRDGQWLVQGTSLRDLGYRAP